VSHVLADLQNVFAGFEVDGVAASHRSVHTTTTRSKTMVDTSASVPTANSPSRSPDGTVRNTGPPTATTA
jgi:hypothetical protein